MAINKDYKDLFRILKENRVKYLIIGAYAVIYYTEPRYTKDIDIWIEPTPTNAKRLWNALAEFGAPLEDVTIKDFCNSSLIYQIGIEPNRVDIIMGIKGLNFSEAWRHKIKSRYGNEDIFIIDIYNLIRTKKISSRFQDKIDLKKLIKVKNLK